MSKAAPLHRKEDDPGDPRKGSLIAKQLIKAGIDAGTMWWMLGHDDEAATTSVTTVIVLLKAVRAVL